TGIDLSQIQLPSLSSLLESALLALGSLVAGLVSSLTTLGLILVIVFFGLLEINKVPQRIFHAFSGDDEIVGRLRDVNDGLRRYLVLKAVTGLAMAVPDTILLLIIGVPFAFLWGLLVFFMNFVPNVGFFISLIPPVVIAYLQFGLTEAVVVLAGFLIVNSLVNTFISPRIMGHGLDLSPTLIFIALLFWGWVLGGVGIFMAVPLLVMIKVLAGHYDDSRWMAVVLSERVAEPSQD
ncbi:MAG: AI-2E family transporter, partial [Candidatus Promineifilaceae bacterium]|nr:AI-2E family transporter [Candidatus Promineifilaceae bacterium]